MVELDTKQKKAMKMVIGYPFVIFIIAQMVNALIFSPSAFVSLPSDSTITAWIVLGCCFVINHSWLMTVTETTRVRYKLYATPEEWRESGLDPKAVSYEAEQALQRCHNAHRNSTENAVVFLILALPFTIISPSSLSAYLWLVGFGVSRLGYTYAYLHAKDNLRGLFMTLGLLCFYGVAGYSLLALAMMNG